MTRMQNPDTDEQLRCVRIEIVFPGGKSHVYKGEEVLAYAPVPVPIVSVQDNDTAGRRRLYVGMPFIATEEPSRLIVPKDGIIAG